MSIGNILDKSNLLAYALFFPTISFSSPALAEDFWCTSKVVVLGQDVGGSVWMQLDSTNADRTLHVCNFGAGANTCQGYLSLATSAKLSSKRVALRITGNSAPMSCSTIPIEWTTSLKVAYMAMID